MNNKTDTKTATKKRWNQKLRDPRKVYEFWLEHPTRSYAAIGRTFHITRQRVQAIITRYRNGDSEVR